LRIALLLFIAVVQTGCGTIRLYSGPELPADRIALVHVGPRGVSSKCTPFPQSVDGREFRKQLPWFRTCRDAKCLVAVLPGPHTIIVTDSFYDDPPITLSFDAAAGCEYVPKCEFHRDEGNWRWSGWVDEICESDSTSKRVSTKETVSLFVVDSILEEEARSEAPATGPNEE